MIIDFSQDDVPYLTDLVEQRVQELENSGEDLTCTENGWGDEYQALKRILTLCQKNG